ncbi:hypothetical protein [Bizionia paragorgiae]|uniref:O-antigen ligase like membrane protein n=1 Tax=Bizionia paragorgiae TaxID=283786 RepID=A0A1H3W188_BIZPA|nr:hypothetical protein [Bizionia paragorgiae]SDZ80897.1 hypothetical protein SAMN04487990_102172 [Bizionia paragorgiae]
MTLIKTKYRNLNFAVLLLVLLYITEGYFKVVLYSTGETPGLLQISKGILLLGLGLYLVLNQPRSLAFIGLLSVSFFIGQLALSRSVSKDALIAFAKLLYPILLLLFFNSYHLSKNHKDKLFLVFEFIMLCNALVVFCGLLFDIKIFNTYLGSRFGFNGLFVSSATSSYVYALTLIYLLAKYKEDVFKNIPNLIIIGSMFCVGTKVSYLFLGCFLTVYFFKYTKINRKLIASSIIGLSVFAVYVFFFKFGIFNEIRQKDGLLSSLMSYRDELFLERTLPYIKEHWSTLNYMFGGVSDLTTKSQIEFIDVFYFFGLVGGGLYYYLFFKAFLGFKMEIHSAVLLSLLFIIVLLAGNFFSYPSIAIYLVILREYLKRNEQNQYT